MSLTSPSALPLPVAAAALDPVIKPLREYPSKECELPIWRGIVMWGGRGDRGLREINQKFQSGLRREKNI